jgi:hypothetical protein
MQFIVGVHILEGSSKKLSSSENWNQDQGRQSHVSSSQKKQFMLIKWLWKTKRITNVFMGQINSHMGVCTQAQTLAR